MDQEKSKKYINRIKVYGVVQGVGFRPFVYRLAVKNHITGNVRNLGGIVEIFTKATKEEFSGFIKGLKNHSGEEYEITKLDITEISIAEVQYIDFTEFRILDSSKKEETSLLPVDLPVCDKCAKELMDGANRRYHNPFISCAVCGPRYTIMEELPYDRHTTAMKEFKMCSQCNEEYSDVSDRRFHAQTISCNDCGPVLYFKDFKEEEAWKEAAHTIRAGGIIAVKGIGGYQFVCSPYLRDTILNLRKLKGREEKPFAVMFEDIESVKEHCIAAPEEEKLLESKARPIVLLRCKKYEFDREVNKDSLYMGVFLPYTPLQILLMKELGPLIMTSANVSGAPIIKDDEQMLNFSSPYLNGVLYHKRKILRSVDDSVVKVVNHLPQLIRRSRGYVPAPVPLPFKGKDITLLGAGGDLKAAFCLYKGGNAFVSQYFGDLEEYGVLKEYKSSLTDFSNLLQLKPDYAVCDLHPNYQSARFIKSIGIPVKYVQHHHAHIASVMAEHQLQEKVIGVAFDGTGYGTDGHIWGGEFLICEGAGFRRGAHLAYNKYLGGDSSQKDGKKTAACLLLNAGLEESVTDERLCMIKAALNNEVNTFLSSSMGRLFDGISSLLHICHKNGYEGECAILLEKEAVLAKEEQIGPVDLNFTIEENEGEILIGYKELLADLLKQIAYNQKGALALGFHYAVADMTVKVCELIRQKEGTNKVVLSGGVFQNSVLLERALRGLMEKGFLVYINQILPPNDGSISLGQVYLGLMDESAKKQNVKEKQMVFTHHNSLESEE